jgi:tripartite-type tricarboxylate transporter receptor subunit TctC
LLAVFVSAATAQTYPTRQITLVIPFAPGGPADFLGRLIGQKMGEDLGQQIVVDNRPGANTIIGAQAVAKAAPDGYTLLMAIDGTLVMNPFLYSKLAYDPFKDFAPISLIALVPSALVGNINVPVNSLRELVEQEKAKPGSFQIGISTPTSQVNVGLLNMMAGTNFTMVPYRGGTTQITGILAGDIPFGMESVNVALPLWRDKRVKILGLVSAQRLSLAPEIPAIAETFPGYDLGIWQSIVAPAGTPREVVLKLHGAIKKALAAPEVREKLLTAGIEPSSSLTREPRSFRRSG